MPRPTLTLKSALNLKYYIIFYQGLLLNGVKAKGVQDALRKHHQQFELGKYVAVAIAADASHEQLDYARVQSLQEREA